MHFACDQLKLIRISGHAVDVQFAAHREIDAPVNVFDSTLARTLLSREPAISIRKGLGRQWEFVSAAQRERFSVAKKRL